MSAVLSPLIYTKDVFNLIPRKIHNIVLVLAKTQQFYIVYQYG